MANVIEGTLAALQALTAANTNTVFYTTDADKEGMWQRFPSGSGTPNGGTIVSDAGGFIWKRVIVNNEYYPEWFKGTESDDAVSINAAIQAGTRHIVILKKGKTYNVTSVYVDKSVKLTGGGKLLKTLPNTGTGNPAIWQPVVFIKQATKDVTIEDIEIDGNRSVTITGNLYSFYYCGINMYASPTSANQVISRVKINNVTIRNTINQAIFGQWCSDISVTNCKIYNCNQRSLAVVGQNEEVTAAINFSFPPPKDSDDIWEYKNFEIKNCLIDQTACFSGGIKISAQGENGDVDTTTLSSVLKTISITGNTIYTKDYETFDIDNFDTQRVSIMAIECVSNHNGAMVDLLISDNIFIGTPNPDPDPRISNWTGPVAHLFGISIGGNSGNNNPAGGEYPSTNGYNGIEDVLISNNLIKGCRRYSIEIAGKSISVSNNQMEDVGIISINGNSVLGGMENIKIIGNSATVNPGYSKGYKKSFSAIWVKAQAENLTGLIVHDNIFEHYLNLYITGWYIPMGETKYVPSTIDITNYDCDMIYVQGSDSTVITDFSIINNTFNKIFKSAVSFQNTLKADGLKITNNYIKYYEKRTPPDDAVDQPPATYPYYAIAPDAAEMLNLDISHNTINCYTTAKNNLNLVKNGNGIKIRHTIGLRAIISNNTIYSPTIGIGIFNGVDYIILTENIITNQSIPYLVPSTSPTNKVSANNMPAVSL